MWLTQYAGSSPGVCTMAMKMTKTVVCMMFIILSIAKPKTDKCKAGLLVVVNKQNTVGVATTIVWQICGDSSVGRAVAI